MTWKTRPWALHWSSSNVFKASLSSREQWKPTAPLELITSKDWNVSHFCRAHSRFQVYKLRGNVSVVFGLSYRSHCKSHLACFTLDFTTTTTTTPPSTPWPPASPLQHPGGRALVDCLVGFHQQIWLSTRKKYGKYGNSDELILLNNGYSEMILVVVIFHLVWLQATGHWQVRRVHRSWMDLSIPCTTKQCKTWSLYRGMPLMLKISWESHWRIFGAPGLQASIFGSPVFLDAPPDLRPGWVLECVGGSEDLVGGLFYELKHYKINS